LSHSRCPLVHSPPVRLPLPRKASRRLVTEGQRPRPERKLALMAALGPAVAGKDPALERSPGG